MSPPGTTGSLASTTSSIGRWISSAASLVADVADVARARGATLEVGVGTGRNLDVYPPDADVIGVDTSANMLVRARQRADRLGVPVSLGPADV